MKRARENICKEAPGSCYYCQVVCGYEISIAHIENTLNIKVTIL